MYNFRNDPPETISQSLFDLAASSNILNKTFANDTEKLNICSTSINEIFKDGLMSVNYYIIKYVQTSNLNF